MDFRTRGVATLDLIFTNVSDQFLPPLQQSQIGRSYHLAILFKPKVVNVTKVIVKKTLVRKFTAGNKARFSDDVKQRDWVSLVSDCTVEEGTTKLENQLTLLFNRFFHSAPSASPQGISLGSQLQLNSLLTTETGPIKRIRP